jgi:hypothetical protein
MISLDSSQREWWYLAGLVATDGCLSKSRRHVTLVAKDRGFLEMIRARCRITNKVCEHFNSRGQLSHGINICGRVYWEELARIGLTPAKSKTMGALEIPDSMLPDFFRGVVDGDGSIRRWTHPGNGGEQWSLRIYSASPLFLEWLKSSLARLIGIAGKIHHGHDGVWVLKYGKMAAQHALRACYDEEAPALERKRRLALSCVAAINGWKRSKTAGRTTD